MPLIITYFINRRCVFSEHTYMLDTIILKTMKMKHDFYPTKNSRANLKKGTNNND